MSQIFSGITVYGLYNDQTGDALFGVTGSAVPASIVYVGGKDNNGNLQPLSLGSNGYLNVNATVTAPSDNIQSGTLTTSAGTLAVSTQGTSALMVQITGTWTGTINFQVSLDGSTWQTANLVPVPTIGGQEGHPFVSNTTANGNWTLPVGGIQQFRVQTTGLATGTANIELTAGQGQYGVFNYSDNAANFLATVTQGTSPWVTSVSGTVAVIQSTSPWVTQDTSDGTSGAAVPTEIGYVGGVNGGNLYGIPLTAAGAAVVVSGSVTVTGTVAVTQSTSPWVVAGGLTNNNAAPAANNVGVLPAVAETAYSTVTYTTGNQVLPVTDLHGALNQDLQAWHGTELGTPTNFGTTPGAVIVGQVNASIFQGTAAISTTNTLFTQISDGTNDMGAMANFGTSPTAVKALNANVSIFSGTTALTNTGGALNVNVSNTTVAVVGTLTNNNAAPAANNVGVLGFVATNAPETYTNGDQVLGTTTRRRCARRPRGRGERLLPRLLQRGHGHDAQDRPERHGLPADLHQVVLRVVHLPRARGAGLHGRHPGDVPAYQEPPDPHGLDLRGHRAVRQPRHRGHGGHRRHHRHGHGRVVGLRGVHPRDDEQPDVVPRGRRARRRLHARRQQVRHGHVEGGWADFLVRAERGPLNRPVTRGGLRPARN
jgi:hypothetical protein